MSEGRDGLRVACVQFRGDTATVTVSRQRLAALVRVAAVEADLVVLPELAATGYAFADEEEAGAVAEGRDGPAMTTLAPIAAEHGCWIVVGVIERDGGGLYNSAWIIDPSGELHGVYRKTLLYEADEAWARPGDSGYLVFEVGGVRVGVGICMDLNDDAFVDWLRTAAIDVLAFPTNWVYEGTIDTWAYWWFRLMDVPVALVAANTWGTEAGVRYTGRSLILSVDRRVLAAGPEVGNGVLRATLRVPGGSGPLGS